MLSCGGEMLMVDELTFRGALSFGIVTSLTFIGSMLIAAIISALLPSALFVNRIGLLSIAVAFIMRAIADIEDISALNWLSLLGWRSVIKPYTNDSLSNAALCLLLCIGLAVLWGFLELHREYGTGRIPARSRDAIPPRNVGGMLRLRWVLERGQLATWGVAVMIMSGFLTSLTGSLKDFVRQRAVWCHDEGKHENHRPAIGLPFSDCSDCGNPCRYCRCSDGSSTTYGGEGAPC